MVHIVMSRLVQHCNISSIMRFYVIGMGLEAIVMVRD
jgi:hypothetical protein